MPFLLVAFATESSAQTRFQAVFLNAENLFDTELGQAEKDPTFLPLKRKTPELKRACRRIQHPYHRQRCYHLDWSREIYTSKLNRLAKTLFQKDPQGPDVIALAEVENETVLKDLRDHLHKGRDYQELILIPGQDPRGINLGVLSRLAQAQKPRLHPVPGLRHTRGILEVTLKSNLPGPGHLRLFVFHFPSQYAPPEERQQALHFLEDLIKKAPAQDLTVAMGDSNMIPQEEKTFLRGWKLQGEFSHSSTKPGTHAYRKRWNQFDWIFVRHQGSLKQKAVLQSSFSVLNSRPEQKNERGEPQRFRPPPQTGVSDHFPIRVEIQSLKTKI